MRGRARATFDRAVPCLRTRVCGDVGVNQLVKVPFLEPRGFRFLTPPNQGLRTVDVSGRGVGAIHDSASALCRAGSVARFPSAQPTKGAFPAPDPRAPPRRCADSSRPPVRDRFGLHGRRGARAARRVALTAGHASPIRRPRDHRRGITVFAGPASAFRARARGAPETTRTLERAPGQEAHHGGWIHKPTGTLSTESNVSHNAGVLMM